MNGQGELFKQQGISKVLKNDPLWESRATDLVIWVAKTYVSFTIEDVRREARDQNIPEPHHHNAWGAVMSRLAKSGTIVRTDRMVASTRPQAHARRIPVWIHKDYIQHCDPHWIDEKQERD